MFDNDNNHNHLLLHTAGTTRTSPKSKAASPASPFSSPLSAIGTRNTDRPTDRPSIRPGRKRARGFSHQTRTRNPVGAERMINIPKMRVVFDGEQKKRNQSLASLDDGLHPLRNRKSLYWLELVCLLNCRWFQIVPSVLVDRLCLSILSSSTY